MKHRKFPNWITSDHSYGQIFFISILLNLLPIPSRGESRSLRAAVPRSLMKSQEHTLRNYIVVKTVQKVDPWPRFLHKFLMDNLFPSILCLILTHLINTANILHAIERQMKTSDRIWLHICSSQPFFVTWNWRTPVDLLELLTLSLMKSSFSSGNSFLFVLATFLRIAIASSVLFWLTSQRTDSGIILWRLSDPRLRQGLRIWRTRTGTLVNSFMVQYGD